MRHAHEALREPILWLNSPDKCGHARAPVDVRDASLESAFV